MPKKPTARKAPTAEERAAKRQEVADRLERATAALLTSEGWQQWVRTRARFHKYSFGNQILIAMQCPDATRVAGFRKWQELKRQVRGGEKAIKILGPVIVNVDSETEPGKKEKRVVGFKGVSVFDYSQTDGEPLPEPPVAPITGDSHAPVLAKAREYVAELGYRYVEEGMPEGQGGYADKRNMVIAVDRNTPANRKLRTVVHEIAHVLGDVNYKDYSRSDAEVIVDTVTVMVCAAVGLDTTGESVPYIAGWGERGGMKALKTFAEKINEVAAGIEKAIA